MRHPLLRTRTGIQSSIPINATVSQSTATWRSESTMKSSRKAVIVILGKQTFCITMTVSSKQPGTESKIQWSRTMSWSLLLPVHRPRSYTAGTEHPSLCTPPLRGDHSADVEAGILTFSDAPETKPTTQTFSSTL